MAQRLSGPRSGCCLDDDAPVSCPSEGLPTSNEPRPAPIERGLDVLQLVLIFSAVVLSFLGRGRHRHWLVLALALPLLRLLLSPVFRDRARAWVRRCWEEITDYSLRAGRTPWRAVLAVVVVPAAVFYLGSGSVPGAAYGDTSPVIPTAVRFVTRGDFRLDAHVGDPHSPLAIRSRDQLPYYVRATPFGVYSNYPAGMTTFAIPVTAISQLLGAEWQRPGVPGRIEKWTGAWLAAASVGLFYLISLRLAPPVPATVCTALVGLASSVFSTASQDLSQHGGVVFWMLLLIWIEVKSSGRPSKVGIVLQALACGCVLTCRVSAVLLVASFLGWVLARAPVRALVTGALAALVFAPWGLFYWDVYHSVLGPTEAQTEASSWAAIPGQNVLGVLVSPGRGLFVYQPWLLVLVLLPCVAGADRGRGLRGWTAFLVIACAVHTLLVSSWRMWWGGDSWGPRLMTEVIPLAALLALGPLTWLWQRRVGRRVVLALGIVGIWMHMAGPYFHGLRWNSTPDRIDTNPGRLWDWGNPPFMFPLREHER